MWNRLRASRVNPCGFTLIEVLVAFVAVTLVLVLGFELLAGVARGTGAIERRQRALMVAEAVLAQGDLQPLQASSSSGTLDGVSWRREVRLYDGVKPAALGQPLLQVWEISVTVNARDGALRLQRLSLAVPPL